MVKMKNKEFDSPPHFTLCPQVHVKAQANLILVETDDYGTLLWA